MKVEVKKIDATKRELKFEIPKDRVTKAMDEVYKDIGKVAKIKGFRPGKVPRHILESHHNSLAQEETIKKIIPEVYQEAIQKEALDPIDMPEIHDVDLKDGIITFLAKVNIRPDVKIKNYKSIPVKRKLAQVTDEEIDKTLDFFKKGQGKDKEMKIDDEFAKGLGYPGLDEFKKSLRRQMELDKEQRNRLDVENQVIDYLIKNSQCVVPKSSVEKQVEHRLGELKERFKAQGAKDEDVAKKEDEMRKELNKASERDLKSYFILEKIAQAENITLEKNENMFSKVLGFLLKEAKWEEAK